MNTHHIPNNLYNWITIDFYQKFMEENYQNLTSIRYQLYKSDFFPTNKNDFNSYAG